MERVKPTGRVIGIDILPTQPPDGVAAIQGDFLSKEVRDEVKRFLQDPRRGRLQNPNPSLGSEEYKGAEAPPVSRTNHDASLERKDGCVLPSGSEKAHRPEDSTATAIDSIEGGTVDVVLSDMSVAPVRI